MASKTQRLFGPVPGIQPGTWFRNRAELRSAGVHIPNQAGISGTPSEGSESIVLSGGYVDDIDEGDTITYTGQGGRDPDTGRQVADQDPYRDGNGGLILSMERAYPVRVTRGYKSRSPFAPKTGYTYSGLFAVTQWWIERGIDGFQIVRFRLERLEESAPVHGATQADPAESPFEQLLSVLENATERLAVEIGKQAVSIESQARYDAITQLLHARARKSGRTTERDRYVRLRSSLDAMLWEHPEFDAMHNPRGTEALARRNVLVGDLTARVDLGIDDSSDPGASEPAHAEPIPDRTVAARSYPLAEALVKSPVFLRQSERAGRAALSADATASALTAIINGEGRATQRELASAWRGQHSNVVQALAALRRLLNIDGYEVVTLDADGTTVILDVALMKEQFHINSA